MEAATLPMPPIGMPNVWASPEPRRPAVFIQESVLIPDWIVDHETFRTWATSADCPEKSRVSFIGNMIWVDSSMEDFFSDTDREKRASFDREDGASCGSGSGLAGLARTVGQE